MRVNIKQISEATGFSPATVSNALNGKRGVNAETAALIQQTAQRLGYLGDSASAMRKVKFVMFTRAGIVEEAPYFPAVISGAERACREYGMEMLLVNLDRRRPDYEDQVRMLHSDAVSSVIILGTEMTDEDLPLIQGFQAPVVVLDYWHRDMLFNAVLINNEDCARYAAEYLVKMGHRRIGYLRSRIRLVPFQEREKGFRLGLREHGLDMPEKYVLAVGVNNEEAMWVTICEELGRYMESGESLPTAFFAEDDTMALAAIKALTGRGVRVPEEVSIVGFDDIPFASLSTPTLTTFQVPKQEIGSAAVRRIRELLKEENNIEFKIQVCAHLVERESVRRLPPGARDDKET